MVVSLLRCGGQNCDDNGAAMAIYLWWRRWSRGGGDGTAAAIFKRRISRGGDNLASAAGIEAVVVVVSILSGGVWHLF